MSLDTYLTVQEVAEYLRISTATAYALLRAGKLTGARVVRDWRIPREALSRFCKDNSNNASFEPTQLRHPASEATRKHLRSAGRRT